jgi:hypothetical protein
MNALTTGLDFFKFGERLQIILISGFKKHREKAFLGIAS